MPEFNNGKFERAVEAMYTALETVAGLEFGNPEARKWLSRYAVALGLDLPALLRMLMSLGVQKMREMREEELDTIAAVTGRGIAPVVGHDDTLW